MNSKYNQKIFEIGRKHFPEANDMEIMSVWNNIQQKDPNITPEQVDEMMPHIKAGLTEKGLYQAPKVEVPQAQAVAAPLEQNPIANKVALRGPSMMDVAMKLGDKGDAKSPDKVDPEEEKKNKLKALANMKAGGF